ncbi:MAG: hypothetical protein ABSF85_12295 [Terriglobales bacterium]
MNRNVLYLIIGALIVAVAVFGYQLYQERQKTAGYFHRKEVVWDFPDDALMARQSGNADQGLPSHRGAQCSVRSCERR